MHPTCNRNDHIRNESLRFWPSYGEIGRERERDNTGCRVGPTIISSRARRTAGSGLGAHRRGLSTGERERWRCGVQVRVCGGFQESVPGNGSQAGGPRPAPAPTCAFGQAKRLLEMATATPQHDTMRWGLATGQAMAGLGYSRRVIFGWEPGTLQGPNLFPARSENYCGVLAYTNCLCTTDPTALHFFILEDKVYYVISHAFVCLNQQYPIPSLKKCLLTFRFIPQRVCFNMYGLLNLLIPFYFLFFSQFNHPTITIYPFRFVYAFIKVMIFLWPLILETKSSSFLFLCFLLAIYLFY